MFSTTTDRENFDQVETLLNHKLYGHEEDGVLHGKCDSAGSDEEIQPEEYISLTVNGADMGDLPIEFTVEGIKRNEFPIIGTYVDQRILPGFQYRVRKLGGRNPDRYFFKGEALTLQSIGRGYGKRITFEGENVFYSDTYPSGLALSVVSISAGDQFTVTTPDTEHPVAEARIMEILAQQEIDSEVDEEKNMCKRVRVTFSCDVNYASGHGLMALYSRQRLQVTGTAIVKSTKDTPKAVTTFIEDMELPHHGAVIFRA